MLLLIKFNKLFDMFLFYNVAATRGYLASISKIRIKGSSHIQHSSILDLL
jgi:hypothetical protein